MFNKQTFYSVNKADPNSIVYLGSDGHLIRLTCEDFSSPEEFRSWKKWSDEHYHQWENADHLYANHTISLENLNRLTASVLGPEAHALQKEENTVSYLTKFGLALLTSSFIDSGCMQLTKKHWKK